jgi:hypothetical protein
LYFSAKRDEIYATSVLLTPDAQFIAAARTDLPRLARALLRLLPGLSEEQQQIVSDTLLEKPE